MKKILSMVLCLMMGMSHATADELTVSDVTIPQGGKATWSVSLANTGSYRQLFEFTLALPEGVTLVENSQKLSERFGNTTSLSYSEQGERTYKFLCTPSGIDTTPIAGNDGVLMTVELQAETTLTVGTPSLTGHVTGIEVTTSNAQAWNPADQSFTITIGEPADTRTILDETSTTAPEAATGVDVRVLRTIKANEWSTICLPFAMTAEQVTAAFGDDVTVELGDADSYETTENDDEEIIGINIKFNDVTSIEANHPYIIRVSKNIASFDVDGVDVAPAERERNRRKSMGSGSYFVGNYANQTEVPEFCLFLSDNKFWYSIGDTKMKAFRGYFKLKDVLTEVEEAEARISFIFDNSETTGISATLNDNGEMINDNAVYDLQGRRVSESVILNSKLRKGLYIVNGKKVIK